MSGLHQPALYHSERMSRTTSPTHGRAPGPGSPASSAAARKLAHQATSAGQRLSMSGASLRFAVGVDSAGSGHRAVSASLRRGSRPHTATGSSVSSLVTDDGSWASHPASSHPRQRRFTRTRNKRRRAGHAGGSGSSAMNSSGGAISTARSHRPTYLNPHGRPGMPAAPGETLAEALSAVDFITRRAKDGPGGGLDIDDTPIFYNTDAGDNMTLSTTVARSPLKFSSCRTRTARFAPPEPVMDVSYNTDTGNKTTVATAAFRSPRTIPSFRSKTPRIAPSPQPPGNVSAVYNTDCGSHMTIGTRSSRSSNGLAPLSPSVPRFPPGVHSACESHVGPGTYQPDCSGKPPPRIHPAEVALQQYLKRRAQQRYQRPTGEEERAELVSKRGPGCYDGAVEPPASVRPHSPGFLFRSGPRFAGRPAGQPPLYGNTPTVLARDRKAWDKSVYIDAHRQRPPMINTNMIDPVGTLKTDTLHKAGLATRVARSPLKYSPSFRSKECRLADLRNPMSFYPKDRDDRPKVGPGDYDPHLVKDRMMTRTRFESKTRDTWRTNVPARMDLRLLSDQFSTLQPRTAYRRRSIVSPALPLHNDSFWGSKRAEYNDEQLLMELPDDGVSVSEQGSSSITVLE